MDPRLRWATRASGLFLAYIVAAFAGLRAAPLQGGLVAAIWPPVGISVAALLLWGYRVAPAIFAADLVVALGAGNPLPTALLLAAGNTLAPAAALALLRATGPIHLELDRLRDVARLSLLAGSAVVISPLVGVPTLLVTGALPPDQAVPAFRAWWLSDIASVLVVTPLLLVWSRPAHRAGPVRTWEVAALYTTALAVGLVFHAPVQGAPLALSYLVFAPLIWAAIRFGQRGATATLALVATLAVLGTMQGRGSFGAGTAPTLLWLQVFVGLVGVTSLFLGAATVSRDRAEAELRRHKEQLEAVVAARTRDLEAANAELKTFSYSVSHDLRAPLQRAEWFTRLTRRELGDLPDKAARYMDRGGEALQDMQRLIDAMLVLSRVSSRPMECSDVDLSGVARSVAEGLSTGSPRDVVWEVEDGIHATADPQMVRIVLENLLGNAWKYSAGRAPARIRFGVVPGGRDGEAPVYFVQDNGIGFHGDEAQALFRPFERLESARAFEGAGIGLTTVQRAVARHGGRVWAEGMPEAGATFFFTLRP